MQKIIRKDLTESPRYFFDDVDVWKFVDVNEYRLMTVEEIKKFETPKLSDFHNEWDGSGWIDSRTEDEKLVYKHSQYPSLTSYQFKRCLLESGFRYEDIEVKILTIKDEMTRELTLLGFREAGNFVRTENSTKAMQAVLGWSDEKMDEFWDDALKL